MKSLQKDTDKGDLEWSEVFKGALLKVEPLPRVGVRGVLRGHTLIKLNSSFREHSFTRGGLGGNSKLGEPSACRSRETS